jgi:hypothetical protein
MPQILLTRDGSLSRLERTRLAALPPPLQWLPGTNGWVTNENMPTILTLLRRAIRRQRPHAEVVIVMDSASQHTSDAVLRHTSLISVHLVLVPAGLTWLLQPLDTHVFATLKRVLASLQQQARAARLPGPLPPGLWLDILREAVLDVLVRRDWSASFAANGLTGDSMGLRGRISSLLGASLPLPMTPPATEALQDLVGATGD